MFAAQVWNKTLCNKNASNNIIGLLWQINITKTFKMFERSDDENHHHNFHGR